MSYDTPRTEQILAGKFSSHPGWMSHPLADFARTLERETAQQAARIAELEGHHQRDEALIVQRTDEVRHLKATIAQLTERLATSERALAEWKAEAEQSHREFEAMQTVAKDAMKERDAQKASRRDEESWWKEKHDYQTRAETAESQLATALAQLKEAENIIVTKERFSQLYRDGQLQAESALAAKTREMEEMRSALSEYIDAVTQAEDTQILWENAQEDAGFIDRDEYAAARDNAVNAHHRLVKAKNAIVPLLAARSAPPAEQKAL